MRSQTVKETIPLLVLLLAVTGGRAQQPPTSPKPLEVKITTSEIVSVTDPLTVGIEIRNTTVGEARKAFTIRSILVELPEPFALQGRSRTQDLVTPNSPPQDLNPGGVLFRSVIIPRSSFWSDPRGCVVYRCANNQLIIRVGYYAGAPQNSGELVEFVNLRPRSALMAVISGGVVGVLLATVFSFLHKANQGGPQQAQVSAAIPLWKRLFQGLVSGLLAFLYGGVATAAAILLLTATTVPDFPVSVSVCDALGGLILGLFFKPVGEFIHSKIST